LHLARHVSFCHHPALSNSGACCPLHQEPDESRTGLSLWSSQGARGNYKGKAENYDPDYHKRLQANHALGQQQPLPTIMPPPYLYQANVALPPLAPRVHFNHDHSVSNPFALNTKIVEPQEKSIFSQDGRFNASTDVLNEQPQEKLIFSQDVCFNASTDVLNENGRFANFTETINGNKVDCMCIFPNNEIYVKIESARDDIDRRMFCMDEISDLHCDYKYKK